MGNFNIIGLTTAEFQVASMNAEISILGGSIIGISIFLLIIIAGFLIFKMSKNPKEYDTDDEDRIIGANKGISKNKIDN
jgi:uncharacterized protein YpmB